MADKPLTADEVRDIFREELARVLPGITSLSGSLVFSKDAHFNDGRNFQFATGVGTKIGTSALQKIGFYGAAPVAQPGSITSPSGGTTIDSQARTAIVAIITALHNEGLTA